MSAFAGLAASTAGAGQYAVAFWREAGSYENAGNHSAHVHVWNESGQPLAGKQIYTSWGVLLGATDSDGYTEIVLNRPNGYDFQIRDGANGTDTTPIFGEERAPNPGQYSFEIGFLYKQNAATPLVFDTNAVGMVNSTGADSCANLNAPHTRSLAYYSTFASNYCSDQYVLGNYVTAHGQTFVANGNRVMAMKALMVIGGGGHFNWTVQVLDGGPNGTPVGPSRTTRTVVDSEYYPVIVTWGANDVQVVPGNTYYYKVTRTEGMNGYHVVQNNYAAGNYFEKDTPMPSVDLMGLVVCATYTNSGPAGTLSGVVRDLSATPIPGVVVTVNGPNLYGITANDGSYSVPFVSQGTYSVTASKPGYIAQQVVGVSINSGQTTTLDFNLTPQATNAGSITGLILDPNSLPIAGARVTAYPTNLSVLSDTNGRYTLPAVYFGAYRLVASRAAFSSAVANGVNVTNGQATTLNFTLNPALLWNGNFEGGFSNSIANGWKTFTYPGGGGGTYIEETVNKLGGARSQRWWSSFFTHHAGIFQQVPVVSNAAYTFSAWTWRSDSFNNGGINQETWVGIDPFGGTNAASANVLWSNNEYSFQTWTPQSASTVARTNRITVFVRGRADFAGGAMQSVVDDASLTGLAVCPRGLTAASGNARVDLAWYPASSGAAVAVKRSTTRGGPYSTLATGIITSGFADLAVTNGTTYEYVVAAGGPDSYPVLATPSVNLVIVPAGSVWKYLDDGSNQGVGWRATNFDDSAWASGTAQLGFGDGDESTLIASNRQYTTYFRRTFTVPYPNRFTNAIVRVLRDDGAVVYLNATEIFRSNMPGGAIDYLTPASSSVPAADETATFYSTNINPNLLVAGTNLLAVEVHQNTNTSSDVSFDLQLEGQIAPPQRPVISALVGSGVLNLSWSNTGPWNLYFTPSLEPPINWFRDSATQMLSNNQSSVTILLPTNSARFYRLQAQ